MAGRDKTSALHDAASTVKRGHGGRPFEKGNKYAWRPGQSGNPEGYSHAKRAELELLARDLFDRFPEYRKMLLIEAIGYKKGDVKQQSMVERLRGTGAKKSNGDIHRLLFEYVFGKPLTTIGGPDGGPISLALDLPVDPLPGLSDEELELLDEAQKTIKRLVAKHPPETEGK